MLGRLNLTVLSSYEKTADIISFVNINNRRQTELLYKFLNTPNPSPVPDVVSKSSLTFSQTFSAIFSQKLCFSPLIWMESLILMNLL